jgi:hypothetical protein
MSKEEYKPATFSDDKSISDYLKRVFAGTPLESSKMSGKDITIGDRKMSQSDVADMYQRELEA